MLDSDKLPRYQVYLLRYWEERSHRQPDHRLAWRFSLENPDTGERQGFATLTALVTFLQRELRRSQDELADGAGS